MKMSPVTELFVVTVAFLAAITVTLGVLSWSVMLIVSPFNTMPWRDAIRIAAGLVLASTALRADAKRG